MVFTNIYREIKEIKFGCINNFVLQEYYKILMLYKKDEQNKIMLRCKNGF